MTSWVTIPKTSSRRYISRVAALNLILPGEDTGDWHFAVFFVRQPGEADRTVSLGGEGTDCDTTPVLGDHGVRDVTEVFSRSRRGWDGPPVFAANHFRAIADLAFMLAVSESSMGLVNNSELNAWLNRPGEFATLRDDYLKPLVDFFDASGPRKEFESWLKTVAYI